MGDIGGAFKMLLVVACFGLAFIGSMAVCALVAIFAPVSIFYAMGFSLLVGTIASLFVSSKVQ